MSRDAQLAELMAAAEALLFVSDEPVSSARLAGIVGVAPGEMDEALATLSAEYQDENRGIQLREVAGGWRLYTHPAYHELIERYITSWDTRRLSQAALEALAIVAYYQPVTRAGVNAIRGVNSEGVISSLVEKGLVRERGREKTPGGAILYGTTSAFLEKFGLKSIKDLPPLEDFAPDEESRELIRERLSGVEKRREDAGTEPGEEAAGRDGVRVRLVDEDGAVRVEEVDRGDEERVDDPEAMAAIIGESLTEKAGFGALGASDADAGDEYEDDEYEDDEYEEDIPSID